MTGGEPTGEQFRPTFDAAAYQGGPRPPHVCPGCVVRPPWHPWTCPVLVRLAAQFLARTAGAAWRPFAGKLAAQDPDTFGPEARFWRAVAGQPDPGSNTAGPDLVPDGLGTGLLECDNPVGVNLPGYTDVLAAMRSSPFGDALRRAFPGITVCPAAFPVT